MSFWAWDQKPGEWQVEFRGHELRVWWRFGVRLFVRPKGRRIGVEGADIIGIVAIDLGVLSLMLALNSTTPPLLQTSL